MKMKCVTPYIICMAFMLVFVVLSLGMGDLEDNIIPLIVSGIGFLSAAIGMRKELSVIRNSARPTCDQDSDPKEEEETDWRVSLKGMAWIVAFFAAILFVGFIIAIPAFVISYMKSHGTSWRGAIIPAGVTLLSLYGIFEFALRITLYRGLFGNWLGL